MARHLAAVMQGISIQARDGSPPSALRDIVDDVVAGVAARFPADGAALPDHPARSGRKAVSAPARS
ncbi:hypothetical protein ACFQ4K_28545 [Tistrella bauzanensis]